MNTPTDRPRAATRAVSLLTGVALLSATACANVGPTPTTRPRVIDSRLNVGEMGARTNFELRTLVAQQPAAAPVAANTGGPGDAPASRTRAGKKPITVPLFWTGVVMSVLGGTMTTAFGLGGLITERQLSNNFSNSLEEGGSTPYTEDKYDRVEMRGEVFNGLAITGAVIGLIGLVLATTSYGIEYTRCGPLAPKKRKCDEAGYNRSR